MRHHSAGQEGVDSAEGIVLRRQQLQILIAELKAAEKREEEGEEEEGLLRGKLKDATMSFALHALCRLSCCMLAYKCVKPRPEAH